MSYDVQEVIGHGGAGFIGSVGRTREKIAPELAERLTRFIVEGRELKVQVLPGRCHHSGEAEAQREASTSSKQTLEDPA